MIGPEQFNITSVMNRERVFDLVPYRGQVPQDLLSAIAVREKPDGYGMPRLECHVAAPHRDGIAAIQVNTEISHG